LREELKTVGEYIRAVGKHWVVIIVGLGLTRVDFVERLFGTWFVFPLWLRLTIGIAGLIELFRDAGIVDDAGKVDGHAHRFRHTFACDLLSQGVPIRQVAAFLGNSVTIVEKHYGGWSEEQQRQADEALQRTFSPVRDASATALERVVKSARLVTRKAHGRREVN
jgi:integrase